MSRPIVTTSNNMSSVPRASGDEPWDAWLLDGAPMCSPRERG